MAFWQRKVSRIWLLVLPAAALLYGALLYWRDAQDRGQGISAAAAVQLTKPLVVRDFELAVGSLARSQPLSVRLEAPCELDRLSRAEVLALRQRAVERNPELLRGRYRPSSAVFGQIASGRPWWGIHGQFFHGPGPRAIDGPSEESRFLLNPFLLVGAEVGPNIWTMKFAFWDRARVDEEQLLQPGFPLYVRAELLRYWPAEARAEVIYPVSRHLRRLPPLTRRPLGLEHVSVDLYAYNARDLRLEYLQISSDSWNIHHTSSPPMAIRHYIHQGGSCGYPGGCNNMSPYTPKLCGIRLRGLPARAMILLWRHRPTAGQPPAMRFVIRFE